MDARSSTPDRRVDTGTGQAMMTREDLIGMPATEDTISEIEWEIRFLDPDVNALIAEVDAILCAALTTHRRSLAPSPATGAVRSRSAGRSCSVLIRPWRRPACAVRAMQRSPRTVHDPAATGTQPSSERQVMASQR
jgi:hypothetical protein